MNLWTSLGLLAGGLGLFLIGMGMMTDGLKLVAGPALHNILTKATRTRWHALGTGVLVTAMVQSSTAVGIAAIGFVNAGLLGLAPAVWVVFGANVGTSMTGWIVALVGLKFKVELLALPLVGLGAVMRLTGEHQRRGRQLRMEAGPLGNPAGDDRWDGGGKSEQEEEFDEERLKKLTLGFSQSK